MSFYQGDIFVVLILVWGYMIQNTGYWKQEKFKENFFVGGYQES